VTEVLERLGHTVEFPLAQTCCGQMHYNTGYQAEAIPLVRRFVEMFADAEAVCVPSASCVAMMREHYELIAKNENDAALLASVQSLLPRIFEFSELLVNRLGVEDVGAAFPHRDLPSVVPLAAHAACGRRAAQAAARGARADAGGAAESGAVLRLRRNVLGEERGRLRGDAGREGRLRARDRRGGGDRAGQLLPDADLRRAAPRGVEVRTLHLAEILAAQEAVR
jgi:hypothetical protein